MSLPTPYYEEDGITIYCSDCREVLPGLHNMGLVLTDPPYGINTKSDGSGKLNPWADLMNASYFYELIWKEVKRIIWNGGAAWMFLNWRTMPTIQRMSCSLSWPIEDLLIWNKEWIGPGGPNGLRPSYEMCALFRGDDFAIPNRGIPDIVKFKWTSKKPHGHPAEKPEKLCKWLIEISGEPQTILDPFMGSGTTLVAAKQLGRKAIGIELEEKYCEIAVQRLRQGVLAL